MERGDGVASLDRRCFLKWGAILGSSVMAAPLLDDLAEAAALAASGPAQDATAGLRIIRAGCPSHNCGGRCLLKLHVIQPGR